MDSACPRRLLVEGKDDYYVIRKLLKDRSLPVSFHIEPKHGFGNLSESLYAEVNTAKRLALGIVADANDDPQERWQKLRKQLSAAGCDVPAELPPEGAVFAGPMERRVGVWLMPDNSQPGELEDLVAAMIPPTDPIWPRAREYVTDIPKSHRPFKPAKLLRAQVHAWLATRSRPRPMGSAIAAQDLRTNVPQANSLIQWLVKMFDLTA